MLAAKGGRATYEDLMKVPDHMVAEIIDGELVVSPRPAARHARTATRMGTDLVGPFDRPPGQGGPGGWILLDEPELHLGENVIVPDLAGWRRERMPEVPDVPAFTLVPDWVCEILSPRSVRIDRVRKMTLYAAEGVEFFWLVDPQARTLEALRREGAAWVVASTHADQDRVRAVPFDAIELDLSSWWISRE